jgi:hypothetical protein
MALMICGFWGACSLILAILFLCAPVIDEATLDLPSRSTEEDR